MTEAYLEGQKLDLSENLSALLNFAIDDIKDFAERSTSWSKTIVLPGTSNNNRLLGNIFDVGHSNTYNPSLPNVGYNFNAAKSASILLFQDNIQTFKGVMRLMEIISDRGAIEYEVAMFGELSLLSSKLSTKYLSDLDFSSYDHSYSLSNIVNSWDNAGGSGYYYPLIDHGGYSSGGAGKHDWDYKTFRPALYVKEYIDKIFSVAGFRYDCSLFNTTRFKKLIIPGNRKTVIKLTDDFLKRTAMPGLFYELNNQYGIELDNAQTAGEFNYDYVPESTINRFVMTYVGASEIVTNISVYLKVDYLKNASQIVHFRVAKNGFTIMSNYIDYGLTNGIIELNIVANAISINPGDQIELQARGGGDGSNFIFYVLEASLTMKSAMGAVYLPVGLGESFQMNANIPKNIRQLDFFKSIVQLFNLYVYEDRYDDNLLHITPYVDYCDTNPTNAKDWTYKLNRAKPVRVKPMSDLNAKTYEFKFKADNDYYNEQFKKRYNKGYGDLIYDSEFEFVANKRSVELAFSATPIVGYLGEDKVYSTIIKLSGTTEEQTDSNIRIMQSKKVSGVSNWSIKNGATVIGTYSVYPYAGHYDDPDVPTNDINFGVPDELFFVLSGGNISTTQFNVYWSPYMAEITNKDSKLLTAKFYLTSKDINELDFSKPIYLDGALWRLNKITEYNANYPDECTVELFKINYLNY